MTRGKRLTTEEILAISNPIYEVIEVLPGLGTRVLCIDRKYGAMSVHTVTHLLKESTIHPLLTKYEHLISSYEDVENYVCKSWLASFDNFVDDMYPGYLTGLDLRLIDRQSKYCKDNCVWVSRLRLNAKRRTTKLNIESARLIRRLHGKNFSQIELATIFGVTSKTISDVFKEHTWSESVASRAERVMEYFHSGYYTAEAITTMTGYSHSFVAACIALYADC